MLYALMLYNLKVGACLALFYLFFRWLLSGETFHRFNRVVLLGGILLSFLLPLCVIRIVRELPLQTLTPVVVPTPDPAPAASAPSFPWRELSGWLFLTGAVVAALRSLGALAAVVRLIRRGRRERLADGTILVHASQDVAPCSWGRCIVIADRDLAEEGAAILAHERAHVRLHHSWDLLAVDLAGCLQWFNPAMWLLRRELRAIHEYEADAAVLADGVDAKRYQMLLIRKAVGGRWCSVANSLNHSKLKNRITMMLRKKSSRRAKARVLLLLPLVGLALGAFAETLYVVPAYKDTQIRVTEAENRAEIVPDTLASGVRIRISDLRDAPIVVVDGQTVDAKILDTLRADRIASISVLKDSLSRAAYGAEARSGVILVTLKRPGDPTPADPTPATDSASRSESSSDGRSMWISIRESPEDDLFSASGLPEKPVILLDGTLFEGDLRSIPPERIGSVSIYKKEVPEEYRRYLGAEKQGIIVIETRKPEPPKAGPEGRQLPAVECAASGTDAAGTASEVSYNTVVGGRGGMLVVGPEVMSKSRSNDNGSVTVAKGRVTADFSEINEADYRIEINGKPATKADLERIEPGRIKRLELVRTDAVPGRQGILRARTRR